MILNQLIEKKDLLLYLRFRRDILRENKKTIHKTPEKERENVMKALSSRMKEVTKLLDLIENGNLKKESKKYWRNLNGNWN